MGEITGWAFDQDGELIDGLTNGRVLSVPMEKPVIRKLIGVTIAMSRLRAIKGAMRGKLINGLITNEVMAELLLDPRTKNEL